MKLDPDGFRHCQCCGARIPLIAPQSRIYCDAFCRERYERLVANARRREQTEARKLAAKTRAAQREPRKPARNRPQGVKRPELVPKPPTPEIIALRALEARQEQEIQPRRPAGYRAGSLAQAEALAAVTEDHGAEIAQVRGECLTGGCSAATQGDSKAPRIDS